MELKANPDEKDAYALIVGISTYQDGQIPPLSYATKDAQAIFELLINPDLMGLKRENIKILKDKEATYFNIKNAISGWLYKNANEESLVIIFFAGHGGLEEDRTGIEKDNLAKYLLPFDANFENFYASALTNREFNELLLAVKSKKLIVFMDSCYSGGVTEKKARDVKLVEDPYKKISEGEGRLVIAASQPNQRSFEEESLGHGIFTHHLIEALKGGADENDNKDGYSTALEVYDYLSKTVPKTAMRYAGALQEPILRGDLKSDIVLVVNRERIEKIKHEKIKKVNQKRLSDWYHDGKLSDELYELGTRLIESRSEDLADDDKKAFKSLDALLSDRISISTFCHDVEIIKGFKESAFAKSEGEDNRIKKKERTRKRQKIEELNFSAQSLYNEGKYREAINKWEEALILDPENQTAKIGISKASDKDVKEKLKGKVKDYCPNCGYQNVRGLNYCSNCGASLVKQMEKLEGKEVRDKEEIEKNIKKYCPNCGYQNVNKLKYCIKCGATLF